MTIENIKKLIKHLGFTPQNKNEIIWSKKYPKYDNYILSLNFEKLSIDYGTKIIKGDETTSNFSKEENFVVLECIDRILKKGYSPGDLTLEKKWKLGRSAKSGKADINVRGRNGKTLLIIECKTWGIEYEKEKERMRENGGQLLSYFQQDKATRFLSIYTSRLVKGAVEYENAIIGVEDSPAEISKQNEETEKIITYQKAAVVEELLKVWEYKNKKEYRSKGIFEEEIEPYNPGFIPIRIKDLKVFTEEDAKLEYYKFEEILRHNNISDRSNAFNRFISLVLAKIVDEEKPVEAIAEFQNKKGIDTSEELLERLQSLYSKAMKDYLGETVINYTLEDIEKIISYYPRQTSKDDLKRIYKELKFYSNNEFSFKEVYNKELFEQNAKVLYEVVDRLENFKFKYNARAQFLGDFFEDMLESGFKQSEGQFFTPTPIAKFIVSSIPLLEIIEQKIRNKEAKILPCVIDYACGSGHFITEALEEIQTIIRSLKDNQHKEIPQYKSSTKWAGEFICGIEKDYRLARTSQVACFMHGDGDAKIIFGDGLEEHDKMPAKQYDVLVANPPYTIKDFKKHLNKDRIAKFELLPYLGEDSDDVEVLFVERTKQLLKENGYAGIFLPSSILTNTGIYTKAREIILKYFEIKAIVEFGGITFSATGTSTVVMFMRRRSDSFSQNCIYIAEDFILGKDTERKEDFADTQKLLQDYCTLLNIPVNDFKSLINRNPNELLIGTELYQSYLNWFVAKTDVKNWKKGKQYEKLTKEQREKQENDWFLDEILEIEKEKFLYFLLSHRLVETKSKGKKGIKKEFILQEALIVRTGKDNESQKKFLGYTFSDRRGYKGLDMKKDDNGRELTMLYDKENLRSNKKVNTYIWHSLKDDIIPEIDPSLVDKISLTNIVDCLDFERTDFDKHISTKKFVNPYVDSKYSLEKFSKIAFLEYGSPLPEAKRIKGDYPVMGSNGVVGFHNTYTVIGPAVIVGRKGSAGKVTYVEENCYPIDTTFYLRINQDELSLLFMYYLLRSLNLEEMAKSLGVPGLNRNELHNFRIPKPKLIEQQTIVKKLVEIEKNKSNYTDNKKSLKENESLIIELQDKLLKEFLS